MGRGNNKGRTDGPPFYLQVRLFDFAAHDHFDVAGHIAVQLRSHREFTHVPDGIVELYLAAVDVETAGLELARNVRRRHLPE